MNKKISISNSLILVIIAVFLSMTINLALAGTQKCTIVPGDPAVKDEYCFNCTQGMTAIAHVDHKPTPGMSGCSAADTWCAGWIGADTCDWSTGVHICKAVCKDSANMPICSQVASFGYSGTSGWIPPFSLITQDYVPLGGCCDYPEDCQVGGKYPHRYCQREKFECSNVINYKIYPGKACCSATGYDCEKNTDCCSLDDKCVNRICVSTGATCVSTDQTSSYPNGDDPFVPGTTTGFNCEDDDRCNFDGTLEEYYCEPGFEGCLHKTIACYQVCGSGIGECRTDIEGRGYCHCTNPTPTTTPITGRGAGGSKYQRAVFLGSTSTTILVIVAAVVIIALAFIAMKYTRKK